MLGLENPPRPCLGVIHSGVPDRRSSTRTWLLRDDGANEVAVGPREFSWLSIPLK